MSGTDKRHPTVNAYGKLYGAAELSTDDLPILDPKTNTATTLHVPVRDADTPSTHETPPLHAVALLGQRSDLGQQGERAQPDAR